MKIAYSHSQGKTYDLLSVYLFIKIIIVIEHVDMLKDLLTNQF